MVETVKQVTVFLTDQPGELAQVLALLAEASINIRALSGNPRAEDHGTVRFVVDDPERAVEVLKPVALATRVMDVLLIRMPDRPRAILEVTERLAAAGVNIEFVYGSVSAPGIPAPAVFKVSDIEKARNALGELF